HKVRLLLARHGAVCGEAAVLSTEGDLVIAETAAEVRGQPVRLKVAPTAVSSADRFLFHKTTNRGVYDKARAACADGDDVVLWNERGEVTETSTANLVIESGGRMITPPVECGLLAGTLRSALLERGELEEEIVDLEALKLAGRVFVINSVRGWRSAVLE